MDIDLVKSSQEDAMQMITMMMQMDKLPEFFGPYDSKSELPEMEFSGGSSASIETPPPLFPNPHVTSSILTSPPSPIPFMVAAVQEPTDPRLAPKFRNASTELSCASSLQKRNSMEAMREMIFSMAVMQPIQIEPESMKPPKRRNVKISKDPQSVAARHRRERISERIRILQRIVPGCTKMDTASMLDEAIHYMKFLKKQVQSLEQASADRLVMGLGFPMTMTMTTTMANMNY